MTVVAGVVIETLPGAAARVGERLAALEGLALAGASSDTRVAMVWVAEEATALESLAARLLAEDDEILGVFPTYVGDDRAD